MKAKLWRAIKITLGLVAFAVIFYLVLIGLCLYTEYYYRYQYYHGHPELWLYK